MVQPTQEQLNELVKLYQSGKLDETETTVQNLLKQFPNDITCLNVLGVVLDRKGQTEEAIKMYQKALQINENSPETHFNVGSILHRLGRSNEARISYEKAISIKSDFLNAHFNLGLIYQNLQDNKKAIESYENAVKLKPDFHQAIGAMGTAFQAQGELDEAIEHYKKALAIQPDARNHFNLGAGFRTKGSLDEAIEQFEKSLSFDNENSETLTSLGDALWHKGKTDEAMKKFDEAIKIDPDHPQANYNLGVFLSDNNKLEEAFIHFERSKIYDSQERALYCLYKTGKYEKFKEKLDIVIANKKNNSPFLATLSKHYAVNFEKEDQYNFCKSPLDFVGHFTIKELAKPDSTLLKQLLKDVHEVEIAERMQSRLHHGKQSAGNLFKRSENSFITLSKLITETIEKYYEQKKGNEKNSMFINDFPDKVEFSSSWYVMMKQGGHLDSHIHEEGWISGACYLSIPKERKNPNEGAITLSVHGDNYPKKHDNFPEKTILPKVGDVVFFPSSVFHNTIPFSSNEERICIAFDVKPRAM